MSESQGRGPIWDDFRVEKAAKRAHENGGSDSNVRDAAQAEFNSTASDLIAKMREKMRRLFGS